jgi:hypothetical protein
MLVSGPSMHPLDRPIWSALTTRQRALAEGGALALRYLMPIAPFEDMVDMSVQSLRRLASTGGKGWKSAGVST